jgi:DNA-binding IclR family transcriptional regulator
MSAVTKGREMLSYPENDLADVAKTTAIQKAFRLMQAIAASDEPQPLAELADLIGMPKPTVHRLLAQLEDVGIVGRDLTGKGYTVGATWSKLAIDALTVRARQPGVRSIMRRLVDQVQESCNLSVLQDHELLYLERVECDWPLRMQLHAGSRVPIYCTASGKLLLANMSATTRRQLLAGIRIKKHTSNTIVDPELLEKEFETIRASGIAINREEYHLGLIGVSVPIRRADQTIVATLSIHAPSFRMSVETALSYVPLLVKSAAEIAVEAGF